LRNKYFDRVLYGNDKSTFSVYPDNYLNWYALKNQKHLRYKFPYGFYENNVLLENYNIVYDDEHIKEFLLTLKDYMIDKCDKVEYFKWKDKIEFYFSNGECMITQMLKPSFQFIICINLLKQINKTGFNHIIRNNEFDELKNRVFDYKDMWIEVLKKHFYHYSDKFDNDVINVYRYKFLERFNTYKNIKFDKLSITADIKFKTPIHKKIYMKKLYNLRLLNHKPFTAGYFETIYFNPFDEKTYNKITFFPKIRFYDKDKDLLHLYKEALVKNNSLRQGTSKRYNDKKMKEIRDLTSEDVFINKKSLDLLKNVNNLIYGKFHLDLINELISEINTDNLKKIDEEERPFVLLDEYYFNVLVKNNKLEQNYIKAISFTDNKTLRFEVDFGKKAIIPFLNKYRNIDNAKKELLDIQINNEEILNFYHKQIMRNDITINTESLFDWENIGTEETSEVDIKKNSTKKKEKIVNQIKTSGDLTLYFNIALKNQKDLTKIHYSPEEIFNNKNFIYRCKQLKNKGIVNMKGDKVVLNYPYTYLIELINDGSINGNIPNFSDSDKGEHFFDSPLSMNLEN